MKRINAYLVFTFVILSVLGCGGGGASSPTTHSHQYTGSGPLDGTKVGKLDLTVAASGVAVGTYSVTTSPSAPSGRGGFSFPLGVWIVRGSLDLTGNYTLSGDAGGSTPFSVTGSLPTGVTNLTYQVAVSGTTFSGTMHPRSGSVGWETINFGNADGSYNGLQSGITIAQGSSSGIFVTDAFGETFASSVYSTQATPYDPNGTARACGFSLSTHNPAQAGMVYQITGVAGGTGFYDEDDLQNNVTTTVRNWDFASGSITIDSIDQGSYTFHGTVTLTPHNNSGNGSVASGTVTLEIAGNCLIN